MNEIRFAARKTHQGFHGAWHLVPFGTVAIVLLSVILVLRPDEGPAPTLAANAMPIAAETTAPGPALAAKPVEGWPAPAPEAGAAGETEERAPTF